MVRTRPPALPRPRPGGALWATRDASGGPRAMAAVGPHLSQALSQRHLELLGGPLAVVEARERDPRQALADRLLDPPQVRLLLRGDEQERVAGGVGPRRPPHAMDVVLGRGGDV